jgi:hypothetical membrane protein
MNPVHPPSKNLLWCAIAVPFWYFGLQVLTAPFYPGYDFIRLAASDLGSPGSSAPLVFNVGAVLLGLITLLGAFGLGRGLNSVRVSSILVWLVCGAVILTGLGSVWAGIFPLPHPLHAANPSAPALILMPFLMAGACWRFAWARAYLLMPVGLMVLMMLIRALKLIPGPFEGALQRLLALAAFAPIALGGWLLWSDKSVTNPKMTRALSRRIKSGSSDSGRTSRFRKAPCQ